MSGVRAILHESFREPVSLALLADSAQVHETHLARAFRKRHGCTVGEYLRRLRVDAAAAGLEQSERPVSEIAAECGFYDQAHLCRVFKRTYGVSPTEYRER
jgi:AraC family transcriptional regulator